MIETKHVCMLVWALYTTTQSCLASMCADGPQPSILHHYPPYDRSANAANLVPSSKNEPKHKMSFRRHHKTNSNGHLSHKLLLLNTSNEHHDTLWLFFYYTKRIKRICFHRHSAVDVICFLYPVFTLLTSTVIAVPLAYLPASSHSIVSNSWAKGLPAHCPTG